MPEEMRREIGELRRDMSDVKRTLRNVVAAIARHEEHFVRINEKLKKLDVLDQIKSTMDALAGEIKSSRDERALSDKTFRDQQTPLTDHELRLFRLERNAKPS